MVAGWRPESRGMMGDVPVPSRPFHGPLGTSRLAAAAPEGRFPASLSHPGSSGPLKLPQAKSEPRSLTQVESENCLMKTKLYESLAAWWPFMSTPAEYEEAAARYGEQLAQSGNAPAKSVLELGSGGGNNAYFLKQRFQMTLVDPSAGMLAHSERLNPECAHHPGDMRTFRLGAGGQFDRVFIQDAIFYMTSLQDLGQAMETAFFHCRPGGALLIAPDYVSETFQPGTEVGGHDAADRSMRYLAWRWDPDPGDHTYLIDFAFLLRDSSGSVRVEHDRHLGGLFPRAEWLRLLREAGFVPANLAFHHSGVDYPLHLFVGVKPV